MLMNSGSHPLMSLDKHLHYIDIMKIQCSLEICGVGFCLIAWLLLSRKGWQQTPYPCERYQIRILSYSLGNQTECEIYLSSIYSVVVPSWSSN